MNNELDSTTGSRYTIDVIAGDGIGQEVMPAATAFGFHVT
jgi:isocitrate dehydrogenase